MGYTNGMLPVTESISERLIRLPFYYELTEEDIETVVNQILISFPFKEMLYKFKLWSEI